MSDKQSQAKGSKLANKARSRKRNGAQMSQKTSGRKTSTAAAVGRTIRNGNSARVRSTGQTVTISGSQIVCKIGAGSTSGLTSSSANTVEAGCFTFTNGTTWETYFRPQPFPMPAETGTPALEGRLGLLALNYDRYRIDSMRFEYEPQVGSTQVGSFVLGFLPDLAPNDAASFDTLQDVNPSVVIPFRTEEKKALVLPRIEKIFYTDPVVNSDPLGAAVGFVYGFVSSTSLSPVTGGTLRAYYTVTFMQPTMAAPGDALALIRTTCAERKHLLATLATLRGKSSEGKEAKGSVLEAEKARETIVAEKVDLNQNHFASASMSAQASQGLGSTTSGFVLVRRT